MEPPAPLHVPSTCQVDAQVGWVSTAVTEGTETASVMRWAPHLAEELGHDLVSGDATGQSMRVLSVVAVLLVRGPDAVRHEGRDRLRQLTGITTYTLLFSNT